MSDSCFNESVSSPPPSPQPHKACQLCLRRFLSGRPIFEAKPAGRKTSGANPAFFITSPMRITTGTPFLNTFSPSPPPPSSRLHPPSSTQSSSSRLQQQTSMLGHARHSAFPTCSHWPPPSRQPHSPLCHPNNESTFLPSTPPLTSVSWPLAR
ncbi:unnamed protein product [Protopolystoma xenopodis]|uniref:Uncharacterized protein n=1 Tax=Protopolystoma xenopodis TaxID=117903 RepID=A0A3S5AGB3_9PLAT|nr:unnamed protein product [Protopolystoma xenopodis]